MSYFEEVLKLGLPFLIDLDNTLCEPTEAPYLAIGEPKLKMVEAVRQATSLGFTVIIYTARASWERPKIKAWLVHNNVHFDRLETGKELGWLVDDRAMQPKDFIKKMTKKAGS